MKSILRKTLPVSLIAIFAVLLAIGCPNIQFEQSNQTEGIGTFSLTIAGEQQQGRTILPSTGHGQFAWYRLTFTGGGLNEPIIRDRTHVELSNSIELPVGNGYKLTVLAYTSIENRNTNKPAAWDEIPSIDISASSNITREITLKAFGATSSTYGGMGIFSWNINVSGVTELSGVKIEIEPIAETTGIKQDFTLVAANATAGQKLRNDSLELKAGYYSVIIELSKANMNTVKWRETLHVYENMTSPYNGTFSNTHFVEESYDVTFKYFSYGNINRQSVITFFYNDHEGVAAHQPSQANSRGSNFKFYEENWYINENCAKSLGTTCDVHHPATCTGTFNPIPSTSLKDLVLHARWTISGKWTHEDEYDTNTWTELQGSVVRGWWVRPEVEGTWITGRVQYLGRGGGTLPMPPLNLLFTSSAEPAEVYVDKTGKLVYSIPACDCGATPQNTCIHRTRIPGIQLAPTNTTGLPNYDNKANMRGYSSEWTAIPEIGGQWRLRREGSTATDAIPGETRLFVNIGATNTRANEATTAMKAAIITYGFNIERIYLVPNILSVAKGRIVDLLDAEMHKIGRGDGDPVPQNIIDMITILPTEVERVYSNGGIDTDRYGAWGAGGFGGVLYIDVQGITDTSKIRRWRASVENYFSTANIGYPQGNTAPAPTQRTNRSNDRAFGIPFVVEFLNGSSYTFSDGSHDNSWKPLGEPGPINPGAPVVTGNNFTGFTFGPIHTNTISGDIPIRMIRLDFDMPYSYVVTPEGVPNTHNERLFETDDGEVYWLSGGNIRRATNTMEQITAFYYFPALHTIPTLETRGHIQYSTIELGNVPDLRVSGVVPPNVYPTGVINRSGLRHEWKETVNEPYGPHRMGAIDGITITHLEPVPLMPIVLEGISMGTLTIKLDADAGTVQGGLIQNVKSLINIEIEQNIYSLVEGVSMVVEFKENPVANVTLVQDVSNPRKWSAEVNVNDIGEHYIKLEFSFN